MGKFAERSQICLAAVSPGLLSVFFLSGPALSVEPGSVASRDALFEQIKIRTAEHLARLPNYTCHATIDRVVRVRAAFQPMDTVELEVAFVGQQELFSRSGEDRFGQEPIEKIVSGGTISNRVLGSHTDLIFSRNAAEFKYAGAGQKDGHNTLRYDLRVPIEKSGFVVRHNGAEGMAGYEGSVWVDAETLDLVRVDFKVNQIPAYLGVRLIEQSLRYQNLTIGNSVFDLPEHSELAATDDLGNYSLNRIKLERCHEFSADSVVKYGAPTEGTASRERQDH